MGCTRSRGSRGFQFLRVRRGPVNPDVIQIGLMKITISNLLLVSVVCAVSVVAWLDRSRLIAELEAELDTRERQLNVDLRAREEVRTIGFRQYWETGIQPLYLSQHAEEGKLRGLLNRDLKRRPTDAAIEIALVCGSYELFHDKQLPDSFIRAAMDDNEWTTATQFVDWLQAQERILEETRLDEARTLIDNAMRSR